MRKVILFNLMTLDGFFAGPNGEIEWHNVDEEFNEFAIDQLNAAGGLIFGRVTYQMMESYWPTPTAVEDDPIVANKMNSIAKFVFSRTLTKVDWNNTRLVKGPAVEELSNIKQQLGGAAGDLYIFGSADLSAAFIDNGLIDEYRVIVNPVILGSGIPLFKGIREKLTLKLLKTRTFKNGNVLLYYAPESVTRMS